MHRSVTFGASLRLGGLLLLAGLSGPAWAQESPATPGPVVSGAQVSAPAADRTEVRIVVQATGGQPTVSAFRASNPERLMVDIAGAALGDGATVTAGGLVTRGEFSSFNDGMDNVRLTLWLTGQASHEVRVEGGTIVLALTPGATSDPLASALGAGTETPARLSGPELPPAGPALTSLDFLQQDRSSRVLLGVQGAEPAVSQPESTLIVIDLPGARIPDSLTRDLDTSRFYSGVESVRARPTRAGARVEVRLREASEYSVEREGGLFVLDVRTPASVIAQRESALQRPAVAAPSTPETSGGGGLSNSQHSELLITESGRTVDPQQMYGTGGGANEPGALAFAEEAPGAAGMRFSGRRMSIDLQEADIHAVFRFIADTAEINIVASDDVEGTVTVRLKDVPWDQALAAVLQAKGLGAQRFGNIVRVAPIESIKAEQQAALEARRAKDDLEPLQVYVAPLNYAKGEELRTQLEAVLSPRGSLEVDSRGNQLIIKDVGASIAQARELLRQLDKKNRQVSIEARFVEANSSFTRSLGIQWGSSVDASATTGYPTGAFFPNSIGASGGVDTDGGASFYSPGAESLIVDLGATGSAGSLALSLGSIPGLIDLDARLSALESEGWGKIVSSPHVSALDNEQALVRQGAKIPYKSVSQGGTQVQFINAALELEVTPHITSDGNIFLDLAIKNDRPDFGQAVDGQPAILTKELDTRVLVPDGDTTVLGGVYSTSEAWSQSRVPGLGSIPLIGYLFKNSLRTEEQNEMLVFITPRVVEVPGGS